MKITKNGRIITIEIEDADLPSNLEEEVAIDSVYTGMKYMIDNPSLAQMFTERFAEVFPSNIAQDIMQDFCEKWELTD